MLNCSENKESTTTTTKTTVALFFTPRQLLFNCKTTSSFSSSSIMKSKTQRSPISLSQYQNLLLLQSTARYLQRKGFSKTLKKLLKESDLQKDNWENCLLDLEEMCYQYLNKRNDDKEAIKEQVAGQKGVVSSEITERIKENGGEDGKEADSLTEKEAADNGKSKSNKKKKSKTDDKLSEQAIVEAQLKPSSIEDVSLSVPSEPEKKPKEKKKKKKKDKGEPERVNEAVQEKQSEVAAEAPKKADKVEKKEKKGKKLKIESNQMGEDTTNPLSSSIGTTEAEEEKKDSKKRKKSSSEEDGAVSFEEAVVNDSKRRKTDNSDKSNGVVEPPKTPNGFANGVLENEGRNQSQKRDKTEHNRSAEPKIPFRRVKPEDVEFLDDRLRDNSYHAKDGADSGYGAKAEEVLGQVKGSDFRKAKNKKKKATYHGGHIGMGTHSIKFDNSDNEEE